MANSSNRNPHELPIAKVDVEKIICDGLNAGRSPEEVLDELRGAGDKETSLETVDARIQNLYEFVAKLLAGLRQH
jgi:hypothetical protein